MNLMERALGMNPMGLDSGNLPAIDGTQAGFALTFTRSRTATDLALVMQKSPDLSPGSWTTAAGTTELIDDSNPGFQRYRFTPSSAGATKEFYRLLAYPP